MKKLLTMVVLSVVTVVCAIGFVACGNNDSEHEHDYAWATTKAATCTEKGTKTGVCKVCGDTKTEDIPALDHATTDR